MRIKTLIVGMCLLAGYTGPRYASKMMNERIAYRV